MQWLSFARLDAPICRASFASAFGHDARRSSSVWTALVALNLACCHQPTTAAPLPSSTVVGASAAAASERPVSTRAPERAVEPLLLRPELEDVRLALEAQDDELAALSLEAIVREREQAGHGCLECHYLLGVIDERRGLMPRAIAAFEFAAQGQWTLADEALIHLVRLELARRNCSRADQLLEQVRVEELPLLLWGSLRAEVDLCRGRAATAIIKFRQLLSIKQDEQRRSPLMVMLAEALLDLENSDAAERQAIENEAGQLVKDAVVQPGLSPAVLERARSVIERLQARHEDNIPTEPSIRERVTLIEAYLEARRWPEAQRLLAELAVELGNRPVDSELQCRIQFATGRTAAALGNRQAALDNYELVGENCDDNDLAARALFLGAGIDVAAARRSAALAKYAQIERRFPAHRLADDARLKQALLYRAVGSESRFVALLDALPEDYPSGDMVLEGLFQLALKNMLHRNWAAARSVLERAERFATGVSNVKDTEVDRLRYFLGKIAIEEGRIDAGLAHFRALVTSRPLTYYMLLARSVWARLRADELAAVEKSSQAASSGEAVPVARIDDDGCPRNARLSALLGVGDVGLADELLAAGESAAACEATVFAIAGMYASVGATKSALTLVKRRGRDWRVRWPAAGWVELWKQAYPRPYRSVVRQQATRFGVPEALIYSVMREESEFDPKAVSAAEAYGLMQLIVPTARIAGRALGIAVNVRSLQNPTVNIALGARTLAKLSERFRGQTALIAAGYNAGPGRPVRWMREYPEVDMDLWIELIEFQETRNYVKRVMESASTYQWLYGSEIGLDAAIDLWPSRLQLAREP